MERSKKDSREITFKAAEGIFWFVVISLVIFMNLSPRVFRVTRPILLVVMLFAFLVIILSRAIPSIISPKKKALFRALALLFALLPFFLLAVGAANIVMFYYLPIAFSVSMAYLIILIPRAYVVMFIAACVFLLSETFSGLYIGADVKLKFPLETSRTFSLIIVVMFIYYFYRKEMFLGNELKALNEKIKHFDAMKSNFVANLSHELRTPLTSIKNAVTLLNRKIDKEGEPVMLSDKELLDIIMSSVDRQARLINSLLNLAKIEGGKLKEERALTDIKTIATDTLKSLGTQASAKSIQIISEIDTDLPLIYASADQITEVYINLLDNAIKYTPNNGRIILRISVSSGQIKSVIEDNGPGIAAENIGKLFDKFQRLEEIVEQRNKGIGLGLVIAKEIIESHGGKIWVESRIGEGTKFIFTLPQGLRNND
jgi:signal transduction histidine kinase